MYAEFLVAVTKQIEAAGGTVLESERPVDQDVIVVKFRDQAGRVGYITASGREIRMSQPQSAVPNQMPEFVARRFDAAHFPD
jgi:hypothetical protein